MSKKSVLDSMKVDKPCPAEWNEMVGNDKVRLCSHCSKNVNNISEMTRKEAIRLVRQSNGSLCIRYYTDPVTQRPMFLENFIQISRRAPRIAAGVISASLSFATMSYAQTQTPPANPPVMERNDKPPINDEAGIVPGGDAINKEPENFTALGGVMIMRPEHKGLLANAVAKDDVDEVRNLIARGEDVNGREVDRTTPLFIAVENGNLQIAEMLLGFGAKVNERNEQKETALMKLDEDASKELVELLVRSGARIEATDLMGNTALILAAGSAKPEVVKALIDAGASVNEKNNEGTTALMAAAYADDVESVRLLLQAGADLNLKNNADETAYDKAENKEVEDLLVSFGAVPKEKKDNTDQVNQIDS
jgi:hypothetical protein